MLTRQTPMLLQAVPGTSMIIEIRIDEYPGMPVLLPESPKVRLKGAARPPPAPQTADNKQTGQRQ